MLVSAHDGDYGCGVSVIVYVVICCFFGLTGKRDEVFDGGIHFLRKLLS